MAVYQVSRHSLHERSFWLFSVSACLLLIGAVLFSFFEPPGISDSVAHSIGWAAGAITLISIVGLIALGVKESTWQLKQKLRFEVSDGRIIKTSDDGITEIPLNQVDSIHEYGGWLLIRGGEPARQIAVPREVNDFEVLKGELTSYHPVTPVKTKVRLLLFLPIVLAAIVWFLVLTSHDRTVVSVSAIVAVALQTAAAYSMLHIWRVKGKPIFFASMLVLTWLLIAAIVFQRVKSVW